MSRLRGAVALLAATVSTGFFASGCTDTPTTPSPNAPFSQTDLVLGTGATATATGTVTVNYTGWFYDATKPDFKGLQFDSSAGTAPFTFTLGTGSVIKGWDQGVPGMREGGQRRLVVPPALAYGDTRHSIVPPNATLLFDITLISVAAQ
ncbi:MAG TPA: FKBP-type peptidyl-prolyl cis-trans isomerase [Vicinamibacterales bacterium]